jgi:hypothetical protein
LDAQEKTPDISMKSILASLGEPETVANRYLLERGLKVSKAPRTPMAKWLTIGFLGTLSISVLFLTVLLWKFTPILSIDDENDRVIILGGLIDINGNSGKVSIGSTLKNHDHTHSTTTDGSIVTREFDSTDTTLISIENGSGNVRLTNHDKKLVTVEAQIISGTQDTCEIEISKSVKEIFVKTKSKKNGSIFSSNQCEVNVAIKSPRSMNLNIKNGSGDIQILNLEGKLYAKNGSGNLSAKGSFTEANIFLGSGNAELIYSELPPAGDLKIQLGSGNLIVFLPKKSSVQTKVRLGSGSQKNYLDNSAPGNFLIDGNIGSGNLTLRNIK